MSKTESEANQANILVVDDSPANLQIIEGMLKEYGYRVRSALNGRLALQVADKEPPDLILLDINMPEMDGYEVCEQLKTDEKLRDIPIIFISALNETDNKIRAFSTGGVDYVTKPFQFEEVRARVETHLRLRRLQIELEKHNRHLQDLVQAQVKEISELQMATIFALAKLAESRDDATGKHLERVQTFCRLLTAKLSEQSRYKMSINSTYIDNIFHASPLHDIGKVGISDNILLKPGKLTPDKFELMKQHTVIGAQTLGNVRGHYPRNAFINMGISIARSHHEKWDGSGYPDGQVGEDIPLSARIMAVADVYDALRSKRCYKLPVSHEESCEIIFQGSGVHFDPSMVDAFGELHDQFREIREKMED